MKILLIGPFPLPMHGCSLANKVLATQLNKDLRYRINYIDTNSEDVSSERVGSFSFKKIISFLKHYSKLGTIKNSDVVYTTPGQTFFGIAKYIPFYLVCIKYTIPYIIHVHGNHLGKEYKELSGLKRRIFKYFVSKASSGIVLSNSLKSNFDGLLPKDKIFVVENFAQDNLTKNIYSKKPTDKLRLLYLSNLMKEKGIVDFLDALFILKQKGVSFTADIAGKFEDESKEEIELLLKKLKGLVKYHGVVHGDAKTLLLKENNVFILPTYYKMEGQPISLIEAMASGNIVITTYYSGIPDIVSESNGFFVNTRDPESIVEKLQIVNDNLEKLVNDIGKFNVNYIKENFTEEQFAKKISNVMLRNYQKNI